MPDVIVIGGGIAGLSAAWQIKKRGFDVRVMEEQDRAGGNIKTLKSDGFRMEIGPHSFMGSSDHVWKLIRELDIEKAVEPASAASRNRFIFRSGRLCPLPLSVQAFLRTPLLSPRAKFRLALEPLIPNGSDENETAWDFFCRRFGAETTTYVMSPFVSGIYAGDVRQLGARAAFAKFWDFERESGSMIIGAIKYMRSKRKRLAREGILPRRGLFSFKGGLGWITEKIADELGDRVLTRAKVETITEESGKLVVQGVGGERRAASVILAVPPNRAKSLLSRLLPAITGSFQTIPMAPVVLVHWTLSNDTDTDHFPAGFGFLMPRLYPFRVLGTIFASQLFAGRSPDGLLLFSSFYGGVQDADAIDLSDAELEELIHYEHRKIFRKEMGKPRVLKILRYPQAIPQLLPDHPKRIADIREMIGKVSGLFLAGNYLTGVGMENAVESGYRAADRCFRYLSQIRAGGSE